MKMQKKKHLQKGKHTLKYLINKHVCLLSSDFVSVMLAIFTTFLQFSVLQQLYPQLLHQRHLAVLKEAKVYIN